MTPEAVACDAKIRPFPGVEEIACELSKLSTPFAHLHQSTLRDRAYPGSATVMSWDEHDRRTFHGDWPGPCAITRGCVLPFNHHGGCVL